MIAVTGATGGLGGRVARRLAAAGVRQRLIVRDPSRAPELPGAEVATGSYGAIGDALDGVSTLLMVSASESQDRVALHTATVDQAVTAGVKRIVYISFLGAGPDCTFTFGRDHWHTEQHIRATGVPFTFLRDSLYLDFIPMMAGADGVIRGPAGDGRVAAVARDDIADAATAVLLGDGDGHDGATYELTGPYAFTFAEAAAELSLATGRPVRYEAETLDEAYASRAGYGAPEWEVAGWVTSYAAVGAGELAAVTDHVAKLAGHEPMSLAEHLARLP